MSDYLGPLTLGGSTDTYDLQSWKRAAEGADLEVIVHATSAATLTAAIEALKAQLDAGNTYVHTFPGSSTPVVFTVAGVSNWTCDEELGPQNYWARCKFTLALSPRPAGALTSLYAAESVLAPASLSLATLLGTNPPALDVTIDDNSGNDMHCVLAALAPTAVSDSMWLVKASALTWTTMTSTTDANAWADNTVRTTTSSSWQTAPHDTAAYPFGTYRVYARVKQSAGYGYVKNSSTDTAVTVTRTSLHLLTLGDIELPVRDSASGTAANLTLSAQSDGTNTLTVDAFLFIPLSWGSFSWHHTTVTSEADQIDVGPSGTFVDGLTDTTYFKGGTLVPRRLACHVGTLVATAAPTGSTWPTDWGRTDSTDVTATGSTFQVATTAGSKYATYAATNAATPLVVPGEWYELSFTRNCSARSAGSAVGIVVWQDVDGNTVRSDTLSTVSATDASPTSVTVYGQAPQHAARAQVKLGAGAGANLTVAFSAVVLRRCPLRLIIVAEDSTGTCSSYRHAVRVSVRYRPLYEVSR